MIQKYLQNVYNVWAMFTITLMITTHQEKENFLTVFDDMIADSMSNKKFQAMVKELFIRCRNLNISFVFITQSYFSVPKEVRLNCTHYLIMKVHNKRELQNIPVNQSTDIDYKDFINIYKKCSSKPYSFLTIDTSLLASNPLRLRKNFLLPYKNNTNS